MPFRAALKHLKNSIPCLCRWQKHQFSFFHAYVVDRSDYFLHFVLMSLTEASIFFFFMLMSLSEAFIFFILCLCRWQKRLFSSFCVYVVDRSDYFLHFAFMSLSEAFIFSILCLCRWQKRFFFFISCLCRWQKYQFSFFYAYVVVRSIGETLFYLTEWCCSLRFLVLFPSNRKYRFQILFLKSTDRVEVGRDDVSIGMMIE